MGFDPSPVKKFLGKQKIFGVRQIFITFHALSNDTKLEAPADRHRSIVVWKDGHYEIRVVG